MCQISSCVKSYEVFIIKQVEIKNSATHPKSHFLNLLKQFEIHNETIIFNLFINIFGCSINKYWQWTLISLARGVNKTFTAE